MLTVSIEFTSFDWVDQVVRRCAVLPRNRADEVKIEPVAGGQKESAYPGKKFPGISCSGRSRPGQYKPSCPQRAAAFERAGDDRSTAINESTRLPAERPDNSGQIFSLSFW